ncbi:PQQ-binding-like beta-propeller repeat protein [Saccharicrinis sp. FJH2]|uniref:outer membrane protein assembly factor BamB family protein n=1 Tax=Saccharicrinis sp. FJH65 TaxID=3344659 RepID=UPI0035F42E7D
MKTLTSLFLLLTTIITSSAQIYQWRGANRDGIYPDKNLASEWDSIPPLVMTIEGCGMGYGSPTITPDGIFVAGMIDTLGYVFAYSPSGEKLWQVEYGPEYTNRFLGSRGTPTIEDGKLYYSGTFGDVICVNIKNGKLLWHKNIFDLYGGEPIKWGYTESPLIYKDLMILTPGGKDYNVIAVSKKTGKLVWTCPVDNAVNAYCSPVLIRHNNKDLILMNTSNNLLMLNPDDGSVYLKHALTDRRGNHPMAPLYKDDQIFYSSGYGEGSVMFTIDDANRKLDTLWQNPDFDCKLSGMTVVDGTIFGTADRKKQWMGVAWNNGETRFESRDIKPGSFVMADDKFFIFTETGEVALAIPDKNGFTITSRFMIPAQNIIYAFAHPVIDNQKLYIRYNNNIWVHDISDTTPQ